MAFERAFSRSISRSFAFSPLYSGLLRSKKTLSRLWNNNKREVEKKSSPRGIERGWKLKNVNLTYGLTSVRALGEQVCTYSLTFFFARMLRRTRGQQERTRLKAKAKVSARGSLRWRGRAMAGSRLSRMEKQSRNEDSRSCCARACSIEISK